MAKLPFYMRSKKGDLTTIILPWWGVLYLKIRYKFNLKKGKSMYVISKEFRFSASHKLEGLKPSHPCSRVHGHNYIVTVELRSQSLNNVGFVVDYRDLDDIKKWIDGTFDHQHLNDVVLFNPTAENLAEYIFEECKGLYGPQLNGVTVQETDKTKATYYE